MNSTRISVYLNAPRDRVYSALIDPQAVRKWMVPDGMTGEVHEYEPRERGVFRISLTYDEPTGTGKTSSHTDTYHGRFVRLIPGREVVQTMEFETEDPSLQGEMTASFTPVDANGGTELCAEHGPLPRGLSPGDNEIGWRMSLQKLATLVESE